MKLFFACVKFPTVLIALLASTIPVSILGLKFAMRIFPFWTPEQFSQYRLPFRPGFSFAETDG